MAWDVLSRDVLSGSHSVSECLMSVSGHLLRLVEISPPCFSFTRFIVGQCLMKMTST